MVNDTYRALFDALGGGFRLSELLYDPAGQPVDWRFLEVNRAFEQQTGLGQVVGRLGSAVAPNTEPYWLRAYQQLDEQLVKPVNQDELLQLLAALTSEVGNKGP